ncbi:MAG: NUDIX domain-containing protein [Pseudomonadota bacterium]
MNINNIKKINFEVIKIARENNPDAKVIKVGILPFFVEKSGENNEINIMVMRPIAEKEILGKPEFQLAKGTRKVNVSDSWCDMREDDLIFADESFHEPLIETALREGNEEIGLKTENIGKLYDLGGFSFISASKGTKKPLHLFAAAIIDKNNFCEFEKSTSETKWLRLEEFIANGRKDHILIIEEAVRLLQNNIGNSNG